MATNPKGQNFVVELLTDIFVDCIPENGTMQLKSSEPPLSISHVCQHWRYVALSTRCIWSGLRIPCTDDYIALNRTLPALRVFLERSGDDRFCAEFVVPPKKISSLLSESLVKGPFRGMVYRPPPTITWLTLKTLMRPLLKRSQRVESITLALSDVLAQRAVTYVCKKYHDLEHLSICCHTNVVGGSYLELDDAFWNVASQLSSLTLLSDQRLDFGHSPTKAPTFHRLRHLSMKIANYSELLYVIRECPVLEALHLESSAHLNPPGEIAGVEWSLPVLHSLKIVCPPHDYLIPLERFLSDVRCEQLHRLEVIDAYAYLNWDIGLFIDMSRPPLEELRLTRCPFKDDSVVHIMLKQLPDLRRLRVWLCLRTARALTLSGLEGSCPLLEEITFDMDEMESESQEEIWTAVENMVRSRWLPRNRRLQSPGASGTEISSYTKLREINLPWITPSQWVQHELYRRIKDCEEQGLVIGLSKGEN